MECNNIMYNENGNSCSELQFKSNFSFFLFPPNSGLRDKCVDSLVFETLIPKPMMQHYISLLLKHRRLVMSGPSGTGKSYLAQRLAQYALQRSRPESPDTDPDASLAGRGTTVTFNMHRQSHKVSRPALSESLHVQIFLNQMPF